MTTTKRTKKNNEFINTTLFKRGKTTRPVTFHAYDLETTNIPQHDENGNFPTENNTPKPLYITAYSEYYAGRDKSGEPVYDAWTVQKTINSLKDLAVVLLTDFLVPERVGERYLAWNGNHFDAYFVGLALLDTDYIIRPYITKSNAIRGLKIIDPENQDNFWEFLDGMAMTGVTKKLKDFIASFAPEYAKYKLDFASGKQFDPDNKEHRAYALRDSEGLYHAMVNCDKVIAELTEGMHLTPTIGNLGIKYFQKMMPEEVYVRKPMESSLDAIHYSLKRGGYCYLSRQYSGPVWKYDINQAYAAAMRDCYLPAGNMSKGVGIPGHEEPAMLRVEAHTYSHHLPPFYWKHPETAKASYSHDIDDAWITSDEYRQLKREGWDITIKEGYYWDDWFCMDGMVNRLEALRMSDPEGPSGPLGTMCKSLGNNAYGKTAEQLGGEELIMARECPEDFMQWREGTDFIWVRTQDPEECQRGYHQPQVASFITAYVRMVVRRAINKNPDAWIYADTDCVVFTEPVDIDIDKKAYGKWKEEEAGEPYRFIVKKGYYSMDKKTVHCKGMNIRNPDGSLKFTDKELDKWWEGIPPKQAQTQRKNFMAVISGEEMYHGRKKTAQKVVSK